MLYYPVWPAFTTEEAIRPHAPYKMYGIRLGSKRSSYLPFKMHYVRSSLHVFAPTGE